MNATPDITALMGDGPTLEERELWDTIAELRQERDQAREERDEARAEVNRLQDELASALAALVARPVLLIGEAA